MILKLSKINWFSSRLNHKLHLQYLLSSLWSLLVSLALLVAICVAQQSGQPRGNSYSKFWPGQGCDHIAGTLGF